MQVIVERHDRTLRQQSRRDEKMGINVADARTCKLSPLDEACYFDWRGHRHLRIFLKRLDRERAPFW